MLVICKKLCHTFGKQLIQNVKFHDVNEIKIIVIIQIINFISCSEHSRFADNCGHIRPSLGPGTLSLHLQNMFLDAIN